MTILQRWTRRLTAPVRSLFAPGMWPPRRIAGEAGLALLLALFAAGMEDLEGSGGAVRIALVALAVVVLSLLRRTLPATALLVVAVGMAEFAGLLPLVFVVSWSAGRRIEPPARAVGVFALAAVLGLGLSVLLDLPGFVPSAFVFAVLLLAVSMVVPALVGRYRSQRRTLDDILREYNAQVVRERHMIAGQARLRERQRIAQDMHDSLGHQLSLISVHTGALEVDSELTGRQREAVGVLREASVTAMRELREVVGLLRDAAVPEPEGAGPASRSVDSIEGLVETARGAGTRVELRRTGEPRPLAPATGHAAYRIAQEGLTNAYKHAPGAAITITLGYDDDALAVEIVNGPRAAPAPAAPGREVVSGGQGLTGLGERTRLLGGMVHAGPTPDGGFRLAGVLPYAAGTGGTAETAEKTAGTTEESADPWRVRADGREQIAAGQPGAWGTGGAGGTGGAEGSGLPKELVQAMNARRGGRSLKIGCGALVLFALAALGVGGYFFYDALTTGAIEQKQYDAVKVGDSENDVRERLPSGDSFVTDGMDKGGPPRPEGAECLHLISLDSSEIDREQVFRFCFRDGRLIEKKTYMVKQ